jgi:transaldolase
MTVPISVFEELGKQGYILPDDAYMYPTGEMGPILYEEVSLAHTWEEYDVTHPLTDAGVAKFWSDWHDIVE